MKKRKLAIIGASYLQDPLIRKAKSKEIETHVFAWQAGDPGEISADYFYPISITEKEEILGKCKEIGIDGICTIASDLAAITVGYVAEKMGLIGNPMKVVELSTNKYLMRNCFKKNGDPSPKSIKVRAYSDLNGIDLDYPVIVKPVDRSGSRGITKLDNSNGLEVAVKEAIEISFDKSALVEEFVKGNEYSVEYISWHGNHHFLAITKKYTTGAPHFIETAHMEPSLLSDEIEMQVKKIVEHALDSLGIMYGASHSEIKIDNSGNIKIIEIGGRMGGDNIGASLVPLSTGIDFVGAVIDVALGIKPTVIANSKSYAGVRFIFSEEDLVYLEELKKEDPDILFEEEANEITGIDICDSSSRFGFYTFASPDIYKVLKYMPKD